MNGSTSVYAQASELVALRRKCQLLMQMVLGILILWLATVLVYFVSSTRASETTNLATTAPAPSTDSLQVRELVVVDAKGTPRVRIGAPLPEPIMLGRRSKRGDPVSGVLLYDAEGNERGGYVTGDKSRSVSLGLDEINRQAVNLEVNDRGAMSISFSNGRGGFAGMGVLPSGAWFRLDKPGQPAIVLPTPTPTPTEGAPK